MRPVSKGAVNADGKARFGLGRVIEILRGRQGFLLACVLVAAVFFGLTNETFLTAENLGNIGTQSSMILLVAFGMTVVIICGGIDLSVGSTAALVGVLTVWLISATTLPTPLAMLVGLCAGTLIGVFHGTVITRFGVPAFIATLATLTALRGFAFVVSSGFTIRTTDPQLALLANADLGPISLPVLVAAATLAVLHLVLTRTALGRSFYAVGGNPQAARLAGLSTQKTTMVAYVICAVLASLAGLIAASRNSSGSPIIGTGWELQAVGIVILGGANLFGGSGSVIGTLLAGLLLGMLNNWMSLEGLSSWVQGLVFGALLIAVVALNQRQRAKQMERARATARRHGT